MSKFSKCSVNQASSHFEWSYKLTGDIDGVPLLWLHGFMGSGQDWLELTQNHFTDFCNILVDLPGHGESTLATGMTFTSMLDTLIDQLELSGIEAFIPIGYSMGGRMAFHLQANAPEKVKAQILLSSAPGLKTQLEREQRVRADGKLMDKLESMGFKAFLAEWYSSQLFGSIRNNPDLMDILTQKRSSNDVEQLRRSLSLMGNGALSSQWENLKNMTAPTLLITGESDEKYAHLNQEMHSKIPGSIHQQIKEAGHAFYLEKPLETARIIRDFLSEIIEGESCDDN